MPRRAQLRDKLLRQSKSAVIRGNANSHILLFVSDENNSVRTGVNRENRGLSETFSVFSVGSCWQLHGYHQFAPSFTAAARSARIMAFSR